MLKAVIAVKERDPSTDEHSVLDIIEVEVPNDPTKIEELVTQNITRFFVEAAESHSDIEYITVTFTRTN